MTRRAMMQGTENCPAVLLESATEEFVERGYRGASIDRIVAAAKVSKTMFYNHFAGKRAVFEAAIEHVATRLVHVIPAPCASGNFNDALVAMSLWARSVAETPEYAGLYRVSIELAREDPPAAQAVLRSWREREGALSRYIGELERSGALASGQGRVTQARFGYLSIGALEGLMKGPVPTGTQRDRWARGVASLLLHGHRAGSTPIAAYRRAPRPLPVIDSADDLYFRLREEGMRTAREAFQEILDVCAAHFLDKGFRDTSLSDVSAQTGVSRMTLRRQFGSKESLFVASIGQFARRLYDEGSQLVIDSGQIEPALERAASEIARRFRKPDNLRLLRLMVAEAPVFPRLSAAVYALYRRNDLSVLDAYIEEQVRGGQLRGDFSDLASEQFHSLAIHGNAALFSDDIDGDGAMPVPHEICRFFLNGCIRAGRTSI